MKVLQDQKKVKEIEEKKRDLKKHIIKQNLNTFDSLLLKRKVSNTYLSDMAFITNYF